MAKRVGQVSDDWNGAGEFVGRVEERKVGRRAARETEIPWTRGPQTRWQKFKRSAVG